MMEKKYLLFLIISFLVIISIHWSNIVDIYFFKKSLGVNSILKTYILHPSLVSVRDNGESYIWVYSRNNPSLIKELESKFSFTETDQRKASSYFNAFSVDFKDENISDYHWLYSQGETASHNRKYEMLINKDKSSVFLLVWYPDHSGDLP